MFKVILWDVDGTLIDFKAGEKAAIKRCFEIFKLGPCTDEMVAEYSDINTRYWKLLELGKMTKPQILIERFREFFSLHGIDTSVCGAFNDEYQVRLGDTVLFSDGASETVEALRGRVMQCAVTNGTKTAQDRKLKNSGLDRMLDRIFISEEMGFEKPRFEFFEKVFEEIGPFDRDEILIVGDSVSSDIKGGKNAGIKTCLYAPHGSSSLSEITADFEISAIPEVLKLI